MTLPTILSLSFWFSPTPPPFVPLLDRGLLVLFVALSVLGILAHIMRLKSGKDKLVRRALSRAGTLLLLSGLIGLLLWSFTFERVPFLSMRVLFVVLFIWFVWTAVRIYRFATIDIPDLHRKKRELESFTKWLPKKKS